jgi:putative membrane protein
MTELLLHTSATTTTWWHWHVHFDVIMLCLAILAAYFYTITQLREVWSDAGRVRRSQIARFVAGVGLMYLVTGSPVDDVGDKFLLSAHMLQHMTLLFVVAPLLLAGMPAWIWQRFLRGPRVLGVAKLIVNPMVALAIVNATFVLLHLPVTMDFTLRHEWAHLLAHVALTASGFVLWWPVLSVVPELPRRSYPVQIAYLFLQSLVPSILASIVTFAEGVVYPFYDQNPRLWGLSAVSDQQIAGGIMKLFGDVAMWGFIAVAFYRWYRKESVDDEQEPRWSEVEEELQRLGMTSGR